MEQFVVPQFIDNEDHIIGPITTRQFLILLSTAFLIFLSYRLSDFALFIILAIFWTALGVVLGFVRPNGRPFHFFLLNIIQTTRRPALRVWKKKATDEEIQEDISQVKVTASATPQMVRRSPVPVSRLSDLALVVDTGGVYRGELTTTRPK
jgi:uncharacterized membrane protein required for colicin V production